jgi:transposase
VRETQQLFEKALGLVPPWKVIRFEFDPAERRLDLFVNFEPGARFPCPSCAAADCSVHDSTDKGWRHLDFFQYRAYLHARVPRVRCERCGVRQVEVPWARPGSGFSHLFEALVMMLAAEMPVRAIADLVGEHDTRIWRVVHHHIDRARAKEDFSSVRHVGVDETSRRRGHHYVSLFCDLQRAKLLFATPGREASTFGRFREDLEAHRGDPQQILELCMDMSPAYLAGAAEHLPDVPITFDRYHLMQNLNFALDQVRRSEQVGRSTLKRSRYLWLRNPDRLSERQRAQVERLAAQHARTGRAYRIKLAFQEFYTQAPAEAEAYLERWYAWAIRSRLEPIQQFARSIREHWQGVLRWFTSKVSNGILEAIASLIQAAKRRARGYRTTETLIAIAYLVAGKLDLATHSR